MGPELTARHRARTFKKKKQTGEVPAFRVLTKREMHTIKSDLGTDCGKCYKKN